MLVNAHELLAVQVRRRTPGMNVHQLRMQTCRGASYCTTRWIWCSAASLLGQSHMPTHPMYLVSTAQPDTEAEYTLYSKACDVQAVRAVREQRKTSGKASRLLRSLQEHRPSPPPFFTRRHFRYTGYPNQCTSLLPALAIGGRYREGCTITRYQQYVVAIEISATRSRSSSCTPSEVMVSIRASGPPDTTDPTCHTQTGG